MRNSRKSPRRIKEKGYLQYSSTPRYLRGKREHAITTDGDGAGSFLRSRTEALAGALALREIIARGQTRSRAVFDCGKLVAAKHRGARSSDARAPRYVQKLAADNNLDAVLFSARGSFILLFRALDARYDSHVNYVARRVELKMHALVRLN